MIDKEDVWGEVETFRKTHFGDRGADLPVDVLTLCEITLRLDVIPFPGLHAKYGKDAGIIPDYSGLYVDLEAYELWETGPVWKQNRLRFSVAHELGHFALHKSIAMQLDFHSLGEFQEWSSHDKYAVEQAANEFAGRLLVPIERLTEYYDAFAAKSEETLPAWRGNNSMRAQFSKFASSKFGVNREVVEVRLDREGLWPVS